MNFDSIPSKMVGCTQKNILFFSKFKTNSPPSTPTQLISWVMTKNYHATHPPPNHATTPTTNSTYKKYSKMTNTQKEKLVAKYNPTPAPGLASPYLLPVRGSRTWSAALVYSCVYCC